MARVVVLGFGLVISQGLLRRYWVAASAILAVIVVLFWVDHFGRGGDLTPATPIDYMPGAASAKWQFLWDAKAKLPRKTSLTIRAITTDEEMTLYMMSLGVFPEAEVVPHTYFGRKTPAALTDRAEYILVYQCGVTPNQPLSLVGLSEHGCIYRSTEAAK